MERRDIPTCHANGTFLRFARTSIAAIIRDLLPGPVKVSKTTFRMLRREAVTPRASAIVKAIDLKGRRAPEAMMNERLAKKGKQKGRKDWLTRDDEG